MSEIEDNRSNILIVDDSPLNIQALTYLLEDHGHDVVCANSAEQCLSLLKASTCDLILMDVDMPGTSGFDACKQLKAMEHTKDIPVIFVTAKDQEDYERLAFEAGGVDYITKPVNPAVVMARVNTQVQLKHYQRMLEQTIDQRTDSLNHTLKELAKSNQLKDEFLATISHELRTPLNGIHGSLHLLNDSNLSDQQQNFLDTAKSATNEITYQVENILVLSEAIAGTLKLQLKPLSLTNYAESIIQQLSPLCLEKDLQLVSSVDDSVPAWVLGDIDYIGKLLGYLLTNAIKFTEQGQITLSISAQPDQSSEEYCYVAISVIDTGIGIDQDKQSVIFDLFQQGEGTIDRRFGGLGIGLPICKHLAELMNGQLEFESTPQRGSTFTLNVRMKIVKSVSKDQNNEPDITETIDNDSIKVLIVEDNPINRTVQKRLVEQKGYTAYTANNGQEALNSLEENAVDVVLMDCQMPVMDGYEATKAIRSSGAAYNDVAIIAVTANATALDKERCYKSGMDDFLSKPVKPEHLNDKIVHWVSSKQ